MVFQRRFAQVDIFNGILYVYKVTVFLSSNLFLWRSEGVAETKPQEEI